MKTKTLDFSCKIKGVDDEGSFSAYGSVFGVVDNVSDVVVKGAFKSSLARKMPAMLWQHDSHSPIGVYTSAKEDDHGLRLEGELILETQKGREAHALMKRKAVTGFSIGYMPKIEEFDRDTGINTVKEVDLWEVSLVTFPCNEAAQLSAVKAAFMEGRTPTIKEFERFLRDAGYSRKMAVKIASVGYQQALSDSEAGETDGNLIQLLRSIRHD